MTAISLAASYPQTTNRWRTVAVAAVFVAGFGSRAVAQDPEPTLAGAAAPRRATLRDSVVAIARAQLGVKYRHGGETPARGFDCSGFVQFVMRELAVDIPRTARLQARTGVALPRDTSGLLPGDILTFARTKKSVVSHVGIYIGDGMFVHASSIARRVVVSPVNRPVTPRIKVWRGARRLAALDDETSVALPQSR